MTDHVIDRPGGTLDSEVLDLASRIFDMARSGDAATLAAYLDAGVPVNLTNTNGDTLVMLAAYYGHESTVAVLIARGADVNRHNRGQTPLAGAVFKNDTASSNCCQPMPIRWQARRPHLRPRGSSKGRNSRGNCCNTSSGGAGERLAATRTRGIVRFGLELHRMKRTALSSDNTGKWQGVKALLSTSTDSFRHRRIGPAVLRLTAAGSDVPRLCPVRPRPAAVSVSFRAAEE
jgi:ankyrin repeat protein